VFEQAPESPAVVAWLDRMRRDFALRSVATVEPLATLGDPPRVTSEHWWIYEFVPRSGRSSGEVPVPMETFHDAL
jgi:hypothetical protein